MLRARATTPSAWARNAGSSPASSTQASRYAPISRSVSRYSAEFHGVVLRRMALALESRCERARGFDVTVLRVLVAAAKQDHEQCAPVPAVDAVARPVVDLEFDDASGEHPMPSGIAALQAVDPDLDAAPGLLVAKTVEPI